MKRVTTIAAVMVAAALAGGAASGPAAAAPAEMAVYGGPLNTNWYLAGGFISTALKKAGVKASAELGASLSNLIQIDSSPAKMGLSYAANFDSARKGEKPFPKPINGFCGIQVLQQSVFQALVTVDSGVKTAAGLKGKTYSGQAVGNLSQVALHDFLTASGMSEKDFKLAVGGQQFGANGVKDRRFVGFAAITGYPSPPMMEVATVMPVRFLPVSDAEFAKLKKINSGYARATLPKSAYPGLTEDTPSFGTVAVVLMNPKSSPDDQYFVTKTIFDNWDGLKATVAGTKTLTPKFAADTPGVELCPGARKFWTEQGAL